MWMVVVLAVLTAVVGAITWQHLTARRLLDQRHQQLQAVWLARAGLELAAARLLADPAGYTEESVALLPEAQVRITVRSEPAPLAVAGASLVGLAGAPLGPGALLAAATSIPGRTDSAPIFLVTSEARYRTDEPRGVVRSLSGRFRRVLEKDRVRLERLALGPGNQP
jgi:hypothetical protein